MAAVVPVSWRVPAVAETKINRPVLGRTLTSACGAVNHLNGWQCRGFAPTAAYQDYWDEWENGLVKHEVDKYETQRVMYLVPPNVTDVHVVMFCLSAEEGGTDVPHIDVSVADSAGADIDVGCYWDRLEGTLPGREKKYRGSWHLLPYMVESANRPSSDILGTPSARRHLSVAGHEGEVVVFKIDTTRCRVVSFFILPVPVLTL